MKTNKSISYKGSFLITTLFFLSMVISAYSLLSIRNKLVAGEFLFATIAIGVTFLLAAVAILLSTRYKAEKVVYIGNKTQEVEQEQVTVEQEASQLEIQDITKILENPYDSLQNALNEVCNKLEAGQGAIYIADDQKLELKYGYALTLDRHTSISFQFGEGLVGRVASQMEMLCLDNLPPDYMTVYSGLGAASPAFLAIVPIIKKHKVKGVLEVSTFQALNESTRIKLKSIADLLAEGMNK